MVALNIISPIVTVVICLALLDLNHRFETFLKDYSTTHPPFGEVREIVIQTKREYIFDYYREMCIAAHGTDYITTYMSCTQRLMKRWDNEQDSE